MTQHTCAYVWKWNKETPSGRIRLWFHGVMTWYVCCRPWFCSLQGLHPHRWSRFHPGSHQALFAQLLGLLWWLWQRLLWDDLSTRLGQPDSSLHSSAAKDTRGNAWSQPWRRACCTCRVSHLCGTRRVDTLSSCRSLCWSHRHEGGCRQCTVASWVLYKTRSDIAWPGGTITRSETFGLSCLLLLLSFKLRFRHKTLSA